MNKTAKKRLFSGLATLLAAAFLTGCTLDGKTQVSATDTAAVSSASEPSRTVDCVTRSNVFEIRTEKSSGKAFWLTTVKTENGTYDEFLHAV